MTLDESFRLAVREEVRAAVRDELRSALAQLKPDEPKAPSLLTVEQVAELLRAKPETVREWARAGRLQSKRAGRRLLFSVQHVQEFLVGTSASTPGSMSPDEHLSKLMGRIGAVKPKR